MRGLDSWVPAWLLKRYRVTTTPVVSRSWYRIMCATELFNLWNYIFAGRFVMISSNIRRRGRLCVNKEEIKARPIHTWIHQIHLLYVAAPVRYHHVNLIFTWSDVSRSGWVFSGRSGSISGRSAQPEGELPQRPWWLRAGSFHMILARLVNILQGVLSTFSFHNLL
jgi:hypothetical protein